MSKNVLMVCDVSNAFHNGGHALRYENLLLFAGRDDNVVQRCVAYCTFDNERATNDHEYQDGLEAFWSRLRQYGIKVHIELVRWQGNGAGRTGKANVDTLMVVDMLTQNSADTVIICSGDRDFMPVVSALQSRGTRVEVFSLLNSSVELEEKADFHINGALLPGVIPITQRVDSESEKKREEHLLKEGEFNVKTQKIEEVTPEDILRLPPIYFRHGEIGSTVVGQCYYFKGQEKYGFMRYLPMHMLDGTPIEGNLYDRLNIVGTRDPRSPYRTAFVHGSQFRNKNDRCPSTRAWEFELEHGKKEGDIQAVNLRPALSSKSTKPRNT